MKVGLIIVLEDYERGFKKAQEYGIHYCQLCSWDPSEKLTKELAEKVVAHAKACDLTITDFWRGYTGKVYWNLVKGPETLGLVPAKFREQRVRDLIAGSDFAEMIGAPTVVSHMGFLPEAPRTKQFRDTVKALKVVAEYCKAKNQKLVFETGQETPVTLLRTIEAVGTGNLGINLDPANLILYGKANPVDALDVFGKYVVGVHGKDALYPTNPNELGQEKRIGDGKVHFEKLIPYLHELGFDGSITIEREIYGKQQEKDIIYAKKYLEKIFAKLK